MRTIARAGRVLAYPSPPPTPRNSDPAMLADLISSGRIVDLMGAFVALEVALLLAWRARTGDGIPAAQLLANIGAGGSLMLALRAALTGASTGAIAAWLVAALVCHGADLALRWRR